VVQSCGNLTATRVEGSLEAAGAEQGYLSSTDSGSGGIAFSELAAESLETALGGSTFLVARLPAILRMKRAANPPHRALEHLAHLARLMMPERLPRKLGAVLSVNAVEKDDVQMGLSRKSLDVRCATVTDPP
jgi:hypothetical protein